MYRLLKKRLILTINIVIVICLCKDIIDKGEWRITCSIPVFYSIWVEAISYFTSYEISNV
ncbi:GSCOCG00000934001-RA-CDS [Cotesia congregata]|nr:GSCOCG00000934001-RA-CDS [Cotesia congregata]